MYKTKKKQQKQQQQQKHPQIQARSSLYVNINLYIVEKKNGMK